jgi:uncharacterized protein (TIGR02452 family)
MSTRISKFLSLVLRHEPERIGIVLDAAGWTSVPALLDACAAHGVAITRAELERVVATSDKQRFALDGDRIRANQGHSVGVELELPRAEPPALLYHGTAERSLPGIRELGIVRGERHHVHLSADATTAAKVGGRHGRAIVLVVRAGDMAAAGHVFHLSANGVWLVEHVPIEYVEIPAEHRYRHAPRAEIARTTLAACAAGHYDNALGARVPIADAISAARDGTVLHELGDQLARETPRFTTTFAVTDETTLAALARLSRATGGHLACLNFASARNPGGGFLGGAQAQEESLARSSALHSCLCARSAFYDRNRAERSAIYLDLALFSPHVPFFRDDDGAWLDAPVLASVITCPAPNASALRQQGRYNARDVEAALRRRVDFVLAIAMHHRCERLVLGAWGAGVFGNDPEMVARAFADALAGPYAGAFAEIVFAVIGDRANANYRAFADAFTR